MYYSEHPLTAFLGPCLTEQAAASKLDTPVDELVRQAAGGCVVRVLTPDGTALYPEWAFDDDGEVWGDVMYAAAIAGDLGDPTGLTFAVWMLCPTAALDGDSPLQWISRGMPELQVKLQAWAALSARTYRERVRPSGVEVVAHLTTYPGHIEESGTGDELNLD